MPSQQSRTISALALLEQPDGHWTVRIDYTDGTADLTVVDDEQAARMMAIDMFATVPTSA